MTMTLRIGRRSFQVASYAEASAKYCEIRDADGGKGASEMPTGKLFEPARTGTWGKSSDRQIAHISYNGKVWPCTTYRPDAKPLYDPREKG